MQLEQIELMRRLIATQPRRLVLARDADELARAMRQGKLGGLLAMEGGYGLEGALPLRRVY
jgi:membrane dipeptidase